MRPTTCRTARTRSPTRRISPRRTTRVSVRRHARLVDYALHDGCNARAWVHVAGDVRPALPQGTQLLTRTRRAPGAARAGQQGRCAMRWPPARPCSRRRTTPTLLHRPEHAVVLHLGRPGLLPAARRDAARRCAAAHPDLKPNDVLVFQEVVSPTTFTREDADRAKRWAVRLTDGQGGRRSVGSAVRRARRSTRRVPITEIAWDAADALPFPLCVSVKERPGLEISVALGNIVLADHGQTVRDEVARRRAGDATASRAPAAAGAQSCAAAPKRLPIPPRFRPGAGERAADAGLRPRSRPAVPLDRRRRLVVGDAR